MHRLRQVPHAPAVRLCSCSVPRRSFFFASRLGAGVAPLHALFSRCGEGNGSGRRFAPSRSRNRPRWDCSPSCFARQVPHARFSYAQLSAPFPLYLEAELCPVRRKEISPPPLKGSADSRYSLGFWQKEKAYVLRRKPCADPSTDTTPPLLAVDPWTEGAWVIPIPVYPHSHSTTA